MILSALITAILAALSMLSGAAQEAPARPAPAITRPASPTPPKAAPKPVAPRPVAKPPVAARPAPAPAPKVSTRDSAALALAARYGFTVRFSAGSIGQVYASTHMSGGCVVTVGPLTTTAMVRDVLAHEYVHVLFCRAGSGANPHQEHVADAGARLLGGRTAFYGAFSSDDTLEAKRILGRMGKS